MTMILRLFEWRDAGRCAMMIPLTLSTPMLPAQARKILLCLRALPWYFPPRAARFSARMPDTWNIGLLPSKYVFPLRGQSRHLGEYRDNRQPPPAFRLRFLPGRFCQPARAASLTRAGCQRLFTRARRLLRYCRAVRLRYAGAASPSSRCAYQCRDASLQRAIEFTTPLLPHVERADECYRHVRY